MKNIKNVEDDCSFKTTDINIPITSYGIILFCIEEIDFPVVKKVPKYLLYQRRDSYEYMDLIRGKWSNLQRCKELIDGICNEELDRIKKYSFDELWDDLWVSKTNKYKLCYEYAKAKYKIYKPIVDLKIYSSITILDEPPWGFPKGLKHKKENNIKCALRELKEEANIPLDDIKVWNMKPFIEVYRGGDYKNYSTYYYIAETPTAYQSQKIKVRSNIRHTTISDEASDTRWLTYEEACMKLEPRRQIILKNIDTMIRIKMNI